MPLFALAPSKKFPPGKGKPGAREVFVSYMEEFRRTLKTDGRIIITLPSEQDYLKLFSDETGENQYTVTSTSREGCVFYSPPLEKIRTLLTDAGFSVDRVMIYEIGDEKGEETLEDRFSNYVFVCSPKRD